MIDLDKFKRFNDTYGHQAGDEVLRGTGRVLRRVLRESDSIARYGGEEFAVIFSRATIAEVQRALTRLRKAIATNRVRIPGGKLQVTISIGAAQVMAEEDLEAIVQRADAALYASKEAGRNCGHWHDGQKIVPILDEEDKPARRATAPGRRGRQPAAARLDAGSADEAADRKSWPTTCRRSSTAPPSASTCASRMAEWKRGGPTLTLVLVEIDHFESLTRLHGPKFRDLLVTSLARVVFAGVREMDMVARYSTSCLAFLLPKAQLFDAIRVADRIREAATQVAVSAEGRRKSASRSASA